MVLGLAFRSIKYFAREGLPPRGHSHRDECYGNSCWKSTYSAQWLLRKDNWMSETAQSEILECFTHAVQCKIVAGASDFITTG